jgi:hypothetical protein
MGQPPFDPQFAAGVTLAVEISKQLITVAAALIAVCVTFGKNVARRVSRRDLRVLYAASIAYFSTIVFAVWHLSTLTGALLPASGGDSLRVASSRPPAMLQLLAFVLANFLLVRFGFAAVSGRRHRRVSFWPQRSAARAARNITTTKRNKRRLTTRSS